MIKYALICQNQHVFDAWFRDSVAFDEQSASGALSCPVCGDARVAKTLMAPAILRKSAAKKTAKAGEAGSKSDKRGKDSKTDKSEKSDKSDKAGLSAEKLAEKSKDTQEMMQVMGKLQDYVVENFDYVGADFADQARAMHYGEQESRAIYGESTPEEAVALYEEGVPTTPLPIVPKEQKN